MSNTITIELCTEDRARLDRIASNIEAVAILTQYIIDHGCTMPKEENTPADDIRKALEEAINAGKPDAEKIAQETAREQTPTIIPQEEEQPVAKEVPPPTTTKTISRAELGAKVREMMTKGYKEQTKAIVQAYAPTVPGVPEDKVTECYERLVALEG